MYSNWFSKITCFTPNMRATCSELPSTMGTKVAGEQGPSTDALVLHGEGGLLPHHQHVSTFLTMCVHPVSHVDNGVVATLAAGELLPAVAEQGVEGLAAARHGPDALLEVLVGSLVAASTSDEVIYVVF